MNMTAEKLISEVLQLPNPVRAFVAEQILQSLDIDASPELSLAWKEEVERRCKEIDKGSVELFDAEKVFKNAYARLS